MHDYYEPRVYVVTTTHDIIHAPPLAYFMRNIRHTTYFFMLVTWYFDHILSSNRGVAYPLTFPF